MKKGLYQLVVVMVALLCVFTIFSPANAKYAGASLMYPNCDTGADPNTDSERVTPVDGSYHYTQSCVGHDNGLHPIGIDNFAIKIKYDLPILGTYRFWVRVGQTGGAHITAFHVEYEGDMACVYAMPLGLFKFSVDTREDTAPNDGAESHCFMMPSPRANLQPPTWNSIISPTCSNFCNEYDDDHLSSTPDRKACASKVKNPFLGVVIQCVTETMDNLFYNKDATTHRTIFVMMQERLKDILKGLLTMYVIFIGYQFVMRKGKVERGEFIWYFLRFALVWYFAAGDGLLVLKPALERLTAGLSITIIEAGFGTTGDFAAAQEATVNAQVELDRADDVLLLARKELNIAEKAILTADSNLLSITNCGSYLPRVDSCPASIVTLSKNPSTTPTTLAAGVEKLRLEAVAARGNAQINATTKRSNLAIQQANYKTKAEAHRRAVSFEGSFGYNLCDYRRVSYGDAENSNIVYDHYPDGSPRVRDMSYMKLWDMIDCRIMKYLGVGDFNGSSDTPQVLLIAIGMLFTNALGILIFILTLIFFVFIILLIFRIAHMYLMAVIALNLIIYMGPLFIPSVLFSSQKATFFDKWLKQLISYTMQPVILFTFLTFLFASFDQIIYGNNHLFYPLHYGDETSLDIEETAKVKLRNQIVKYRDPENPTDVTKARCPDEDTIGCIYQSISEKYSTTDDFGFGKDFTFLSLSRVSTGDGITIFLGLLKLFIMAYVLHSVIAAMEDISVKMTDAVGGGAAKLSGVPSPGLTGSAAIVGKSTLAVGKVAAWTSGVAARGVDRLVSKRKGAEAASGGSGSAKPGGGKASKGGILSGGSGAALGEDDSTKGLGGGASANALELSEEKVSSNAKTPPPVPPRPTEEVKRAAEERKRSANVAAGRGINLASPVKSIEGVTTSSSSTDGPLKPVRPAPPPPTAKKDSDSAKRPGLVPTRPAPPPPTQARSGVLAPKVPTRNRDDESEA